MTYIRHELAVTNVNLDGSARVVVTSDTESFGVSQSTLDTAVLALAAVFENDPDVTVITTRIDQSGTVL